MAVDLHVAEWIVEFVLRQPIEDWVANKLVSILPLPDDNSILKRTILLRKISSDFSKGSISETILDSMEMIEEIDHRDGSKVLDSMKVAYCAVAVECTVRFLREEPESCPGFANAIDRILNSRISQMENSEAVGLVSDRFKDLKKELEAAVVNPSIRAMVLSRNSHCCALDLLGVFLKEAKQEMGPCFLELAAESAFGSLQGKHGQNLVQNVELYQLGQNLACSSDTQGPFDPSAEPEEGRTGQSLRTDMHNRSTAPRESGALLQDGAIEEGMLISDQDDASSEVGVSHAEKVGDCRLHNQYDCLRSTEVCKVQEALRSSSINLRKMVEDPLPDALNIAVGIEQRSKAGTEQANQKSTHGNQGQTDMGPHNSLDKGIQEIQVEETNQCMGHHGGIPKPSLMDRNHTARTSEWDDDSIESPSGKSPTRSRGLHLPSPKQRAISPLKRKELTKFVRRKKPRKWSSVEEETLIKAVQEHGEGNWKLILNRYPEIFDKRTAINLKDKWRNLMRSQPL